MRRVRLTRILSRLLNGFDLSKFRVGEVVLVPETIAAMLMAEEWAEPEPDPLSNDPPLAKPPTSGVLIGVPRARARNVTVGVVRQPRGQVFGIALDSYRVGTQLRGGRKRRRVSRAGRVRVSRKAHRI
ncbi:MAG: hypothetical protein PVSMB1_11060 [Gemmatimonadaceae bacterium]